MIEPTAPMIAYQRAVGDYRLQIAIVNEGMRDVEVWPLQRPHLVRPAAQTFVGQVHVDWLEGDSHKNGISSQYPSHGCLPHDLHSLRSRYRHHAARGCLSTPQ